MAIEIYHVQGNTATYTDLAKGSSVEYRFDDEALVMHVAQSDADHQTAKKFDSAEDYAEMKFFYLEHIPAIAKGFNVAEIYERREELRENAKAYAEIQAAMETTNLAAMKQQAAEAQRSLGFSGRPKLEILN